MKKRVQLGDILGGKGDQHIRVHNAEGKKPGINAGQRIQKVSVRGQATTRECHQQKGPRVDTPLRKIAWKKRVEIFSSKAKMAYKVGKRGGRVAKTIRRGTRKTRFSRVEKKKKLQSPWEFAIRRKHKKPGYRGTTT